MAKSPEWLKFKVGNKSETKWTNPDCQPLDTVHHVTHIDTALRVLSDSSIKAGLVYDQSKLNTQRIPVVWLSPNDWTGAGGFRYGNVRFSFDFAELINKKNYYWVESLSYGVAAVRILITDNSYVNILNPYDPTIGDGPWWFDRATNTHYWNSDHCLEIMFEGDLAVERMSKLDFVKHHPRFCNIKPQSCPDCAIGGELASTKFLAAMVGQRVNPSLLKWVDNWQPEDELCYAWNRLKMKLMKLIENLEFNQIPGIQQTASSIGRAVLGAYACGDNDDIKALSQLFSSDKAVIDACAKVISEDFEIADRKSLDDI